MPAKYDRSAPDFKNRGSFSNSAGCTRWIESTTPWLDTIFHQQGQQQQEQPSQWNYATAWKHSIHCHNKLWSNMRRIFLTVDLQWTVWCRQSSKFCDTNILGAMEVPAMSGTRPDDLYRCQFMAIPLGSVDWVAAMPRDSDHIFLTNPSTLPPFELK